MTFTDRLKEILSDWEKQKIVREGDYELCENHPLSRMTSFRTGGEATVLFPQNTDFLIRLFPVLQREKIPYFLLGNGSNVIARDEGYEGIVISLIRLKKISVSGERILAECGALLSAVALTAQKCALAGMENFYGIPGTVGGAVFMNAGAYGKECKDILESVTFLTKEGEIRTLPPEDLSMSYRKSVFEDSGDLILSAVFRLEKGDEKEIRARMDEWMEKRVAKQPLEYPSAGSTFKRYEGRFTAKMIEEAGLKGARVGGAMVSEKHAGFVINYDHATSGDIFALIRRIQDVIWEKEGVRISCEVRVLE